MPEWLATTLIRQDATSSFTTGSSSMWTLRVFIGIAVVLLLVGLACGQGPNTHTLEWELAEGGFIYVDVPPGWGWDEGVDDPMARFLLNPSADEDGFPRAHILRQEGSLDSFIKPRKLLNAGYDYQDGEVNGARAVFERVRLDANIVRTFIEYRDTGYLWVECVANMTDEQAQACEDLVNSVRYE